MKHGSGDDQSNDNNVGGSMVEPQKWCNGNGAFFIKNKPA